MMADDLGRVTPGMPIPARGTDQAGIRSKTEIARRGRAMRFITTGLPLIVVVLGVACSSPSSPAPSPEPPRKDGPHEGYPTKEEVLAYLDGKAVSLTDPKQPAGKDEKPHILKRDQIEALQVNPSGSSFNDGPWSTTVNFIFNTGDARYAMEIWVSHRLVENKRAFFGMQVKQVSRQ
jgi:hypothetical protein